MYIRGRIVIAAFVASVLLCMLSNSCSDKSCLETNRGCKDRSTAKSDCFRSSSSDTGCSSEY